MTEIQLRHALARSLGEGAFALFAIGVLLNSVEAFIDPDGWLWDALRLVVGVAWLALLIAWVIAKLWARR